MSKGPACGDSAGRGLNHALERHGIGAILTRKIPWERGQNSAPFWVQSLGTNVRQPLEISAGSARYPAAVPRCKVHLGPLKSALTKLGKERTAGRTLSSVQGYELWASWVRTLGKLGTNFGQVGPDQAEKFQILKNRRVEKLWSSLRSHGKGLGPGGQGGVALPGVQSLGTKEGQDRPKSDVKVRVYLCIRPVFNIYLQTSVPIPLSNTYPLGYNLHRTQRTYWTHIRMVRTERTKGVTAWQ